MNVEPLNAILWVINPDSLFGPDDCIGGVSISSSSERFQRMLIDALAEEFPDFEIRVKIGYGGPVIYKDNTWADYDFSQEVWEVVDRVWASFGWVVYE